MDYFIVIATVVVGMMLLGAGVYILLGGGRARSGWFAGFLITGAVHCLGYALELVSGTVEMAMAFIRFEYLGIAFHPFFGLFAALEFVGDKRRFDRRLVAAMLVAPATLLALVYTNGLHHQYYAGLELSKLGALSIVRVIPGVWYKVFAVYGEALSLLGVAVVLRALITAPPDLKAQYRICLLGFLAPAIGNALYALGWAPRNLDPAPAYLLITMALLVYGMCSNQLLNVAPLARSMVVDNMADAMMVVSNSGRIVDHNAALQGAPAGAGIDLLGNTISAVFSEYPEIADLAAQRLDGSIDVTLKDGSDRVYRVSSHTVFGSRGRAAAPAPRRARARYIVMSDITAETKLLQSTRRLAYLDSLTNVANRRMLRAEMKDLREKCGEGSRMCVLMIDLDDFKSVNDRHGHQAGDKVLQAVAAVLKRSIRSGDTLVRYGGEEFVVLAPGMELEDGALLAERLRRHVSDTEVTYDHSAIRMTASIGVAAGIAGPGAEQLIRDADHALYEAKKLGKNRVVKAS